MGASALLPFPIAHPRDRCARTKLLLRHRPSGSKQSHLAHGQGIEVIVEAGAPRPCHWMGPTPSRGHLLKLLKSDVW